MLDLRGLNLDACPVIEMDDLPRLDDPGVIFEGELLDSDGELAYVYSVCGYLDGRPIVGVDHVRQCVRGALVGGDAIIVHAKGRKEADVMATEGLLTTIQAQREQMVRDAAERQKNPGLIIASEYRPRTRH